MKKRKNIVFFLALLVSFSILTIIIISCSDSPVSENESTSSDVFPEELFPDLPNGISGNESSSKRVKL